MTNTLLVEEVTKILRTNFKKFKCIQSVYLYGSILTDKFHKDSDIDILFIVDNIKNRHLFLKKVKAICAKEKNQVGY